jgi:hypothetical protein
MSLPWFARVLLVRPAEVEAALDRLRASGLEAPIPTSWQLTLGVLRMWHRVLFRSDTIGTCVAQPPRATLRARVLAHRPLRFPFLLAEKAIAPWDFSGLLSSRERIMCHLLGAHHDGDQFVYDLEMLRALDPRALEELVRRARAVARGEHPRAEWLKDLCVYDGYHDALVHAAERARDGTIETSDDPDISFFAYLAWCARQPRTYDETRAALRAGRFTIDGGLAA